MNNTAAVASNGSQSILRVDGLLPAVMPKQCKAVDWTYKAARPNEFVVGRSAGESHCRVHRHSFYFGIQRDRDSNGARSRNLADRRVISCDVRCCPVCSSRNYWRSVFPSQSALTYRD